jgi:predicted O-linked N-acetylglucosamine transferase (SPINDLY family)
LQLPELVTSSLDDYKATAIRLGLNPTEMKLINKRLFSNVLTSNFYDVASYTRNIELAFEAAHNRYKAGMKPGPIEIKCQL